MTVPFAVDEPPFRSAIRSPLSAVRLAEAVAVAAALVIPLRQAQHADFALLFGDLLGSAPRWVVDSVVGAAQIGLLLPAVLGLLSQVAQRRFGRLGRMLLASAIAVLGLLAASKAVGNTVFQLGPAHGGHEQGAGIEPHHYGIGPPFPTTMDFGIILAWMFTDWPRWLPRWRRVGRAVVAVGVVARLGVGLADPIAILLTIAVAAAAAQLVHLALGVPETRARGTDVGEALRRLGHEITSVVHADSFRRFDAFRVDRADGGQFFVKVVARDSWTTSLPVRLYRSIRFRDAGEEGLFWSLRTSVEHEALCALKALADGLPTPRLAVVTELPPNSMMLAFDTPRAAPLSQMHDSEVPPRLVESVWSIVAGLRRSHTVHHRLNDDALIIDEAGAVSIVEFGSASLAVAGPQQLAIDTAEVLASTAAHVGVELAVEAAVSELGIEAVAECLPRLQPLALTRSTRNAVKAAGCLDTLRAEVERVTGTDPAPVAEIERIKPRSVATVAMAAVAIWTLAPQLVGVSAVWTRLGDANWWWVVAALAWSVVTYIGAALALNGSLPDRLPLAPNLGVQVATSFVGVAAPGGALALTARFLQRRGVDAAGAAAAVGVDTIAGVVVHVTLTGLFIAFAGTSGLAAFHLPSMGVIGLVALGVVVLGLIGLIVPWSRALAKERLLPAARRSLGSVGEVARRPAKMIELIGGSLAITLGYILALEVAVAAFGAGPSFTSVALVYLLGSVVSSVAPTPGGIGAVEATLIAGLTSAGMASPTAVAAVMVFRLATFWLPLLPGWGALLILQRTGDL